MSDKFGRFQQKMQQAGLSATVITAFKYYYDKLTAGERGLLTREMITRPDENRIIDYNELGSGITAPLEELAVIKLNGGLGTSMGLDSAKSLLTIKNGQTFLDIIARQILHYRQVEKKQIPLLFMNSFNTSEDTLAFLRKYPELKLAGLPLDFLQNKFPKVEAESLLPYTAADDLLTWNPPGHGEIYMVLQQSGVLDVLLEKGYRYIFISNSDNLGAVVDTRILDLMANQKIPFIMEVCHRTEMDKKGGHLAGDAAGKLLLRESAQCPTEEISQFQDVEYYRYFNTNNLWVDLTALQEKLHVNDNFLQLTPIMNRKTVNGTDIYQLESAMGAAINVFDEARAVVVNRQRFVPVKKTNEFLAVLSDAYELNDSWKLHLAEGRDKAPQISLEEKYYGKINDFEERLKGGLPSLRNCESLNLTGNIFFGDNIIINGNVTLSASGEKYLENRTFSDGEYKL
ncbi:MAG: UTP--glucose-1-phosphate uridylyltransferase [Candidatus Cloacimonetes bacterium]|nr:UTP--glucose-1-phosphate uridylyltransferase [Candidatus Cloacimonadota bacterium]